LDIFSEGGGRGKFIAHLEREREGGGRVGGREGGGKSITHVEWGRREGGWEGQVYCTSWAMEEGRDKSNARLEEGREGGREGECVKDVGRHGEASVNIRIGLQGKLEGRGGKRWITSKTSYKGCKRGSLGQPSRGVQGQDGDFVSGRVCGQGAG
jgi:hypothetical protein